MGTKIGYARCSTDEQDREANRHILPKLGVPADRISERAALKAAA